jgi:hypothetical protein
MSGQSYLNVDGFSFFKPALAGLVVFLTSQTTRQYNFSYALTWLTKRDSNHGKFRFGLSSLIQYILKEANSLVDYLAKKRVDGAHKFMAEQDSLAT